MPCQLYIDPDLCFGGGTCALAAPHLFIAQAGTPTRPLSVSSDFIDIEDLVNACPSGALQVGTMGELDDPDR
jgi:ferredoxin